MRNAQQEQEPTIIDDIGAIALLYAGVFRMIGRRLNPQSRQRLPALPDDMLPPPLPVTRPGRRPTHAGAHRG
jgi:hypothetical protein